MRHRPTCELRRSRHLGLLATAVVLAGVFGCTADAPPPARAPGRIVALAPSVTEVLYALGAADRVVGVCAQCDYPAAAAGLPRVGGYLTPSVEAVVALRPDLAIVVPSPGNREAVRAIERDGVRVLVVQDRTLADLWASIRAVATAIGDSPAGERLVGEVSGRLDGIRERVIALPRRRVLVVVGHSPLVVVGHGTLQDELLAAAGGLNVAADVDGAWPQVSLELVVARAPEVIVDAAMGSEQGNGGLFEALSSVPAVAEGRIVALAPDTLMRAGPRVPEAVEALAAAIHPEAFPHAAS